MTIEVFKTNVADTKTARLIVDQIESHFTNCKVNFDLDDCDRILRVVFDGRTQPDELIDLLKTIGCEAEVLLDKIDTI